MKGGGLIKALKIPANKVKNIDKATSVEGYGDKVITDEYGNFIPASEIYKHGIVNSSGNMEGFIPEVFVTPKYSITKDDLKPKLYSGSIQNHPDASYMSNAYLDGQIKKAENVAEANRKAGEVNPLFMLNLAGAGVPNWMSPTQLGRGVYDIANGQWDDYVKGKFLTGNAGVVTDNFQKEHPYWSLAANLATDAVVPGLHLGIKKLGPYNYTPIKSYIKAYKNIRNNPKYISHSNSFGVISNITRDLKGVYKGNLYSTDGRRFKGAATDNVQFLLERNPRAIGFEIHLGGKTRPSMMEKKFAYNRLKDLPSGSYISSFSLAPSLEGLMQERGVLKTIFSKDHGIFSKTPSQGIGELPLTENSYEELLNIAKKHPDKFRLDVAHNMRGSLLEFPNSVDMSKPFYNLYHDAINTGDLTRLNSYLKEMNVPKASFNKMTGKINLSLPVLYKKKFGGKLS